jgi:hypothetical protein
MDEQQTPTTVPLTTETLDAAFKASEASTLASAVAEERKPQTLDPYILFTQIDAMRKEGVDEDTIREAFNQFMASRMGTARKAVNSMKRTPDSVPMPTQDDINKMYTENVLGKEILSQDMETILEELENSRIRRANAPSPVVLSFKQRLAQRVMMFVLGVTIWVFKKLGVE